jgi:hypothetical protein
MKINWIAVLKVGAITSTIVVAIILGLVYNILYASVLVLLCLALLVMFIKLMWIVITEKWL